MTLRDSQGTEYLTAGEFAKLARTTKRTILWYAEKEILEPKVVNEKGYRFYHPRQIIDFQVIELLTKLRFPLSDIKNYTRRNANLRRLFKSKRGTVEQEIQRLQKVLDDIDNYYINLRTTGTLVRPVKKKIKPFEIYYIEVHGQYAKIKEYGLRLKNYFSFLPKDSIYLTIFINRGYTPKNADMRIGVIAQKDMRLKEGAKGKVLKWKVPGYTAFTYLHVGSGVLLSLLWQELAKFAKKNHFGRDVNLPFEDLELYRKTSLNNFDDPNNMEFEIHLPIRNPL